MHAHMRACAHVHMCARTDARMHTRMWSCMHARTGTIPKSIRLMRKLERLFLHENRLTVCATVSLCGTVSSLCSFCVPCVPCTAACAPTRCGIGVLVCIQGAIPDLSSLRELRGLYLGGNRLTGACTHRQRGMDAQHAILHTQVFTRGPDGESHAQVNSRNGSVRQIHPSLQTSSSTATSSQACACMHTSWLVGGQAGRLAGA